MDYTIPGYDMAMAADLCLYPFHSLNTSTHLSFLAKPALKKRGEPRQIFLSVFYLLFLVPVPPLQKHRICILLYFSFYPCATADL
jgi:hypothetical protein